MRFSSAFRGMFGLAVAVVLVPGCSGQFLGQVLGNDGGVVAPAGGGPSIVSFSASPASVAAGSTSTLSWQVTGATSVSLTPGFGDVTHQSAQSVQPIQTTTYTLIAVNAAGSDTRTVVVTVGTTPPTVDAGTGDDFPSTAIWYQDISQAAPDPNSDAIIAALSTATDGNTTGWAGSGSSFQIDFSLAVLHADPALTRSALQDADPADYDKGCDVAPIPLPSGGNIEGEPDYTCTDPSADCHLLVYQGRRLYEAYHGSVDNGVLSVACEALWDLDHDYWQAGASPYSRGDGCTSSDAAGFPVATLVATGAEFAAGSIPHSLRLILRNQRMRPGSYVHPAVHAGAPSGTESSTPGNLPPYGAQFRLKASFDESHLNASAQIVAHALKTYGMFVADGGNIPLTFDQSAAAYIGPGDLASMHVTDFEIMPLGTGYTNLHSCPDTRVQITN